MAQNTIYLNSSQTSAPTLTQTAGLLATLLDACLVNGFNSQTISTLSVTSNVATATFATAHGFAVDDVIAISGANESQFNSNWNVKTVADTTTLTFDITTADVTATGTITCKMAPLGWEIAYTGTNLRAYRSPSGSGNRRYLRIDDTTTTYATVQMYKTMSGISTGTAIGSAQYWMKSSTSGNKEWHLIGDKKMFYWMPVFNVTYGPTFYAFGDYLPIKAGDTKNTILIAGSSSSAADPASENNYYVNSTSYTHTICESFASTASGVAIKTSYYNISQLGVSSTTGPNAHTIGFNFSPVDLMERLNSQSTLIGRMPGLLNPLENSGGFLLNGYKFTSSSGVRCIVIRLTVGSNSPGSVAFIFKNDWV